MFNNLRKFLQGEVSHNELSLNSCFYLLSLAVALATSAINIARADVCFLPDGKGCEQVPYEEYGGVPNPPYPKDCFATKEEAMSARTSAMDSYYKNGDMWCLKSSCSEYLYNSEYKGGNWSCDQCPDANSIRANFYNCTCPLTAKSGYEINYNTCAYVISQCTGSATTSCVASECQTCAGTGQYSGGNECKIPTPVTAHCPDGYVPNEPAGGCYSTQDMLCGSGKCYKATETPDCSGEGKRLAKANGVCSCECKTGYHPEGSNCVLNQCSSGVAENTCDTSNGYTFAATGTPFTNTNGDTIKCGECTANPYGQCYASEDECITNVWGGSDPSMRSWYRSAHACMQEGNCWIGKSYIDYTSRCKNERNSDRWFGIQKEGSQQSIQLTSSIDHFIDPGEYHIFTHSGGGAVFTIGTDHGESYELSSSPMNVGSHGEALNNDYTFGNFEFKSGYHYTLIPECTSNETIYTASVYCNNTGSGYAECTFTDDGYYFNNVYVKLQGIINGKPDEEYRTILKGETETFNMGVSGGTCWFNYFGQDTRFPATMIPSSSIYCEYKYKRGEYNEIVPVE